MKEGEKVNESVGKVWRLTERRAIEGKEIGGSIVTIVVVCIIIINSSSSSSS